MQPVRTEEAIARNRVRIIVRVRWLGAAFAALQVLTYATLPYPPGVQEAAFALVAVMAVSNAVFEVARRRMATLAQMRRLAVMILGVDVLVLSGLTWVFAFDDLSALFAILFLLPIEAAVLLGLPGALWTWGAVAVLYTGREWFATRYGNPFELDSLTFRVGLIGMVALIVGLLVRDLTEQRRATSAALREAQRSEESRSRLISMLAHDVRAPIAAARSAFDTLRAGEGHLDPEKRLEILAAGARQVDRAMLLARDLLDLARVESGTLAVDVEDVAIEEVVARVEAVLAGRLDLVTDLNGLTVRADPVRLEQVLFNLLDNAAKYGAPPHEVSARRDRDHVVVRVRDHGQGIPDGVELFTPFSHAGEGSVGLGIWIVRQLVEAMDGTVDHEPGGEGATFRIRLPAPQTSVAASSSESGTT